jgi:hypothetical protein
VEDQTTDTVCSDCGAAIELAEPRRPCEQCGGTARTMHVVVSSVISISSGSAHTAVERGWPRPWSDRWSAVNTALQRLRMAYVANRLEAGEFGSALNGFFIESAHMYDALGNDPWTGLTGQAIFAYVRATPLRIGQAYANTYKHIDRSKPEDLRAYVSRDGDSPEGRFATIKYWSSVEPE